MKPLNIATDYAGEAEKNQERHRRTVINLLPESKPRKRGEPGSKGGLMRVYLVAKRGEKISWVGGGYKNNNLWQGTQIHVEEKFQ